MDTSFPPMFPWLVRSHLTTPDSGEAGKGHLITSLMEQAVGLVLNELSLSKVSYPVKDVE